MGPVVGEPFRSYHAPLVSAHAAPRGREVALQALDERAEVGGASRLLSAAPLEHAEVSYGLPSWRYRLGGGVLERRVAMVHGHNVALIKYAWSGPTALALTLRPGFLLRGHSAPLGEAGAPLRFTGRDDAICAMRADGSAIEVRLQGARATLHPVERVRITRPLEPARGYGGEGVVEVPGALRIALQPGASATLVIADGAAWRGDPTVAFEVERARRRALGSPLRAAADAFVIRRPGDGRAQVIAGYPWFGSWGRDTFIALEGLTLTAGRPALAREVLVGFGAEVRDGLIPNQLADGPSAATYNTCDATLWFVHALGRYHARTGDRGAVDALMPKLREIFAHHRAGTRFGIGVDARDGLLRASAPELQLTWMDAKVDGWVVTPRRGKPVEVNALWFQALQLMARWTGERAFEREAARVRAAFNTRFWCEGRQHLFDVVDGEAGDEPALRPNQLLAVSLPHPALDPARWPAVMNAVRRALWTPLGLRTLAPDDPHYRGRYAGDVRSRDGAYHQGTVWPWWVGAWVDANLAVDPDSAPTLRASLNALEDRLRDTGSVDEVFDGDAPHAPEGCPLQAWSVAELLRARERVGR